jgi:hypothetical protein
VKEQVETFLADLLSAGVTRQQLADRGYDFALALQADQQEQGEVRVSAAMMARAASLVKDALPGAYRIYERRNMMR